MARRAGRNDPHEQLTLQPNGNLQLILDGTSVIWQSGTPSAYYSTMLKAGTSIYSANGDFQLTKYPDGNLVEYLVAQSDPIWSSGTTGNAGAYMTMQNDGQPGGLLR